MLGTNQKSTKHEISKRTGRKFTSDADQTSHTSSAMLSDRAAGRLARSYDNFQNTFRKKGTGPYQDLAQSSIELPFGKGWHFSGTPKVTGTQKKTTPGYYAKYRKNPISQSTVQLTQPKVSMPQHISSETHQLCDRKYLLPSERHVKPFVKHYHNKNSGYILQHVASSPNPEQTHYKSTTGSMKNLLGYGFAKHKPSLVTGKVTQMHLH